MIHHNPKLFIPISCILAFVERKGGDMPSVFIHTSTIIVHLGICGDGSVGEEGWGHADCVDGEDAEFVVGAGRQTDYQLGR